MYAYLGVFLGIGTVAFSLSASDSNFDYDLENV
jgi:hypothetical protein